MGRDALIEVLNETRAFLARPGSDFGWSSWNDQSEALAEIDRILQRVTADAPLDVSPIQVLFLPTGDLQEVSISSGWGDDFLNLAKRFDRVVRKL
jgi:hypothetical protein